MCCVCLSWFHFILAFVVVVVVHVFFIHVGTSWCALAATKVHHARFIVTHTAQWKHNKQIDGVEQTVKTTTATMCKRERARENAWLICACVWMCANLRTHRLTLILLKNILHAAAAASQGSARVNWRERTAATTMNQMNAGHKRSNRERKTDNKSGCYHESNSRNDYTFIVHRYSHKMKLTTIRDLIWANGSEQILHAEKTARNSIPNMRQINTICSWLDEKPISWPHT